MLHIGVDRDGVVTCDIGRPRSGKGYLLTVPR
jgi:hypothetical protein